VGRCGSGGSRDKEEDKRIGADRIYVPLLVDGEVGEVETNKMTREFAQTGFMFPCGWVVE